MTIRITETYMRNCKKYRINIAKLPKKPVLIIGDDYYE